MDLDQCLNGIKHLSLESPLQLINLLVSSNWIILFDVANTAVWTDPWERLSSSLNVQWLCPVVTSSFFVAEFFYWTVLNAVL